MARKRASVKFQRFDYNPRCEPAIARGDEVHDGIKDATKVLVDQGYGIAARDAWETGAYARSIHGELNLMAEGWVGALVASDWKAHFIEWGTARNFPARHVLQRAVFAAGLRFFEVPK